MRRLRLALPILASLLIVAAFIVTATRTSGALVGEAERMRIKDRTSMVATQASTLTRMMTESLAFSARFAATPFELTPGSAADKAMLDASVAAMHGQVDGFALLGPDGALLTHSGDPSSIPPAGDPGYAELRRRLDAGRPGVTPVMWRQGPVPTNGYAVDVVGPAGRRGTSVVFAKLTGAGGYQTLVQGLPSSGDAKAAAVLLFDQNRVLVAGRTADDIGTQLPQLGAYTRAASGASGLVDFREGGVSRVLVNVPVGDTGYSLGLVQDAGSFYGEIRTIDRQKNIALFGLLGLLGVIVVVLWGRKHQLVRRRETELGALLGNAADAVLVVKDGSVSYSSPAIEQITGRAPAGLDGVSFAEGVLGQGESEEFAVLLGTAGESYGAPVSTELGVTHIDGSRRWVDVTVVDRTHDHTLRGHVVTLHDVTERKELESAVVHRSLHDSLTDLANRHLFDNQLQRAANRALRGGKVALLYIDLDSFKPINDTFGHQAGDAVLVAVAKRLQSVVRAHDTVARLGGDEFAILLEELDETADAIDLAERVLAAISEPVALDGHAVTIGASIGVAVAGAAPFDTEALIQCADLAMYTAKDDPVRSIVLAPTSYPETKVPSA